MNNDRSSTGNWLFKYMAPEAMLSDTSEVTFCLSVEGELEKTGFGMLNTFGQNTLPEPCAFNPAPPGIQKIQENANDNFNSCITSKFCVLRLQH